MTQFCTRCKKAADAPKGFDLPRIHGQPAHPSCWIKAVFEESRHVEAPKDYVTDVLYPREPD